MHLKLYPLDVQNCDFDLISYAHTTKDIEYEWDTEKGDPVQLKSGVGNDLPNFHLEKIDTKGLDCVSHTNTGSYACLRMRIKLSRLFSYYVFQLYIPTGMIVVVSWVSFWIDQRSTAGRVALGTLTMTTMTTVQSSINSKLPPVQNPENTTFILCRPQISLREKFRKFFIKPDYLPAKIDYYARFLTPLAFIGFNAVYWSTCALLTSEYEKSHL
uniref:Uncharacterized protein n=1 Tax=Panagrolaimus davidi TaxID=227884 RepID=A0A914PSS6_9BILA